jgi:predicted nucleic acid-binding protein
MVVVDASAVVEALAGGTVAPRLQDRLRGEDIHAPFLIEVEAMQALRRFVRAGYLSEDRAAVARDDLDALALVLYPHRPLMERIWELRASHTAYDASYIALAEILRAPIVTCDARMAKSTGHDAEIELFAPPT